jgi:hypothetical protein
MFKISLGFIVIVLQIVFNDIAFAEEYIRRDGIEFRSWTAQTPIARLLVNEKTRHSFQETIVRSLENDEMFSQLKNINIVTVQEGDHYDAVTVRIKAEIPEWTKRIGELLLDINVVTTSEGEILTMTVVSWASQRIAMRGFIQDGPSFDLPRAIVIER